MITMLCFHCRDSKLGPLTNILVDIKKQIFRGRYKIYLIISPWKIAVTILMMLALVSKEISPNELFNSSWNYEG